MKSDTSSEINVNYLDKNGNKLETKTEVKRQTSDTDFYFGMVANQEKVINLKSESSSDFDNIINSSTTSKKSSSSSSSKRSRSSTSKPKIDNLNLSSSPVFKEPQNNKHAPSHVFKEPQNNKHAPSKNIPHIEPTTVPIQNLTPQEVRMKKIELLRRLSEIKSKGYNLTKEYDFSSSIEEMEYEYALLKSFADKRNGTKLYKNILLNGISLFEFVNDKYDPFEFKLNGWSEHMSVEIDSYEDIIEELYEKYKSTGKSTPAEIRLIFLIFASGAAFHFSKTQLGGIPGVSSAATGMIGKMMSGDKKESQFMSPQEINLEKQKQLLIEREKQLRQQQAQNNANKEMRQQSSNQEMPQQMQQQMPQQMRQQMPQQMQQQMPQQSFDQQQINQNYTMNPPLIPQFRSNTRDIPDIRAPENVNEILSRIQTINRNNTSINTTETQDESTANNDRLVSESTFSDNKIRNARKPKKPVISINTN